MNMPTPHWVSGPSTAPLPPAVPGLPLLGSGLKMINDPLGYLVSCYQQFGPIFRLAAPGRNLTVMAGLEANQFLARAGDEHFSSELLFGGFACEMGTRVFLVALDGEEHRRLRKLMRRGYSREMLAPRVDDIVQMVRETALGWQPGQVIPVLDMFQRLVAEQLGWALVGRKPGAHFEDVRTFLNIIMRSSVLKMWPGFMLHSPAYRRAKASAFALAEEVIAMHRSVPPGDARPADLIDDMLAARDEDGQPFDENALVVSAIAPFFAGIDTVANTLAFMLYALLKHPGALARVTAAARTMFAEGVPSLHALKDLKALHGAALETLRMYPVAAFTPRAAAKPFEFAGCRVDQGTEVLVANGVTHRLAQFFPDPDVFDIDRYSEPRNEHRQPNVFAPYSLGGHTCLGAGLAEAQIMLTMAALLTTARLELEPPNWEAKIKLAPLPSVGRTMRARVIETSKR
jgi:cytochrome P450